MKVLVHLIESEAGWGQRTDEERVFRSLKAARAYVARFNKGNDKDYVPSWYMYAKIVEVDGEPYYA